MGTEVYLIVMVFLGALFATGLYLTYSSRGNKPLNQARRSFIGGWGGTDQRATFIGLQLAIQVYGSDDLRSRLVALLSGRGTADRLLNPEKIERAEAGYTTFEPGGLINEKVEPNRPDNLPRPAGSEDVSEKREFLKSLSSLLIENRYAWEYGFWDYRSATDEAIEQYNQWKNELESTMATTVDEVGGAIDPLHRYSDEKEFLVVTLLMMIDNRDVQVEDDAGTYEFRPTYAQLAAPFNKVIEEFEERQFWEPSTFEEILNSIRALDPRVIERDSVYIIPGAEEDGLSSIDLLSDTGWKYLTDHPIRPL